MQVADRPLTFRNAFLAGALDVPGQRSLRRTRWQSGKQEIFIGSDNVEGTAVYGADRQKIGSIERVMIDKMSGKVAYAVLGYGGFLGIGDDHYPTPWASLKYDRDLSGYITNVTRDQLDEAPHYRNDTEWAWSRENDKRVYDHYQASPFW
jgi:hypothetical protein